MILAPSSSKGSNMMHSITTCTPFYPTFDDNKQPSPDATIWRISLSAARAFQLICDIEHAYANPGHRPRVGGMLEADGAWTVYLWPRISPDSQLPLLMIDKYGAVRLADVKRWHGEAWVTGDKLGKILVTIATREYWEPRLLADEVSGYLLSLPRQVAK